MGIPLPLIELQSQWIAGALSGKLLLPSEEEMLDEVEAHYKHMEENRIPKHHTHVLNLIGVSFLKVSFPSHTIFKFSA